MRIYYLYLFNILLRTILRTFTCPCRIYVYTYVNQVNVYKQPGIMLLQLVRYVCAFRWYLSP